jgi:flagellar secretion chaperone FliS
MNMNPYERYRQQDLETSNRQELVGKLYNEASVSLKRAVHAIEQKKFEAANEHIKKSQVIVKTLEKSLDMQYDIAGQLQSLYGYMLRRMLEANLKKDTVILNEISEILIELRNAWVEAVKSSKKIQSI